MLKSGYRDRSLSLSALLLVGGAVFLSAQGDFTQVATLHKFWLGAGVMGVGFVLSWQLQELSPLWFWAVAIAARLCLLPMEPGDDVWRYLWEGKIQTLGFSPYDLPPNAPDLATYRPEWWPKINHPDVTAIYPPLTQLGFRLLAAISPNLYLFKFAFVLPDLLICALLSHRFGRVRSVLYAWNPMILYTFAGGAHYDSWFMLPLVAAWLIDDSHFNGAANSLEHSFRSLNWVWSAVLVGVSVAVKWVSLPILGFLVWRSLRQFQVWQAGAIGLLGILPMLFAALPFCRLDQCSLIPTESTFVVSGRSAELIPHFVAKIWPSSLQANWIYLLLIGLWAIGLTLRSSHFQQFAERYWFGLLTLTPIVHFWYFAWMIPFAVPSQNWGIRLVSLSGFIYFVLPSRLPDWRLTEIERLLLWMPFVCGWFWSCWRTPDRPSPDENRQALSQPLE